jgi:hypothetical protein
VYQFTARDDHGTSYATGFRRRRGRRPDELAGEVTLDPGPPPGTRWLDLTTVPGGPAVRIDLSPGNGPPGSAGVTVREAGTSPGEHLLHQMATRLLLLALAFPHEIRLHPAVPGPEPFSCVADGLGDVIAALQACGAMSALSPVPGQLAALCASLDVTGHGITARPARQLPGPWLSMLAHYHRRQPEQALGRDGCAAVAAALPELDGIAGLPAPPRPPGRPPSRLPVTSRVPGLPQPCFPGKGQFRSDNHAASRLTRTGQPRDQDMASGHIQREATPKAPGRFQRRSSGNGRDDPHQ